MELIIKPTAKCNFSCTFCSAYGMNIKHPTDGHVPEQIKNLINQLKPTNLIITGGEPLMVHPNYYLELHNIGNYNISITSNLKDFYINPERWASLFAQPWLSVVTSFNYGDTRQWKKGYPYDVSIFVDTINKFKEYTGKSVESFIAIIDESNEDRVMDHVHLAKNLGCKVRLNNALAVGKQKTTYPKYKMLKHYIDIIDAGYCDYECNCLERREAKCPHNVRFMCESCIRSCYVDNDDKLHVSICDEQLTLGHDIKPENYAMEPKPSFPGYEEFIKDECGYCEMFTMCHGCKTQLDCGRNDPNFCEEMKKLLPDLQRQGWLI